MGGGTTVHYREGGTNGTIQEYREFQPLVCATVTHINLGHFLLVYIGIIGREQGIRRVGVVLGVGRY